jgi:cold shock CspA family protein
MRGRITRLIEDQQFGAIVADNGAEYLFFDVSVVGATFGELHVGARVTFTPLDGDGFVRQASAVRVISK